ncbi:MAG: MFS transporter [Acidimicrobiales bacterium]
MVVVVTSAAACVSQAFGRFTYSLLFTDVRDDLGLSNTVAGAIGSSNLGAYLLGSLVVGLIVGRLGLARTLAVGICGSTLSLAVLSWGPSLPVVFPAATTAGFFGAFVWITGPGLATAAVGPARRGMAVGMIGAGIGLGIVGASLLASATGVDGWRHVYRVETVVGAAVTVGTFVGLGPELRQRAAPLGVGRRRAGLGAITEMPGWAGLLTAYGLFAWALTSFVTFTVAVLDEDAGWTRGQAATAFTALGVGTVAGGPVFGPMSDRFGRGRALAVAFAVIVTTAVVLPTGLRPWSLVAAFAFGMAFTGVPTTVTARVSDTIPPDQFGAAYSAATLAFGAGLLIGPQLGGVLADVTGSFRPVFGVVVACGAVGGFLALRQPADTRRDF